jgi:hypothetical protein
VCVCVSGGAPTGGVQHPDSAIAQERFYYIHYAVPYHVIDEIISSRFYSWLPFRIFIQFVFPSLVIFF